MEETFICDTCEYSTAIEANVDEHSEQIDLTKISELDEQHKFICEPCGFSSGTKGGLNEHYKTDKHQKKMGVADIIYEFNCEKCNVHTNNISNYQRHLTRQVHLTEVSEQVKKKEFICKACEFTTYSNQKLKRHNKTRKHLVKIATEDIVFKYNCDECDFHSNIESNYRSHLKRKLHITKCKIVEPLYKFICNKCDYKTNDKRIYGIHLASDRHLSDISEKLDIEREEKIEHLCNECSFKTTSKAHFVKHLNMKHPTSNLIEKSNSIEKVETDNEIGYNKEVFIFNLLKDNKDLTDLELIGFSFNKFDIIFKCIGDEFLRGIQIKTIRIAGNSSNCWVIGHGNKVYEEDTIMIGVNNDYNVFCIYLARDTKGVSFALGKNYKQKDNVYVFTNLEKFRNKLYEMIKISTIIKNNDLSLYNTENHKREYEMMESLKSLCEENNLSFKMNNGPPGPIDCYIGPYRIQCKSSSTKKSNFYLFSTQKSRGKREGNGKKIPYDSTDFDYLICQIIPSPNDFYTIPMEKLIERGYVKDDVNKGKCGICLPAIERIGPHWTLDYLNRFDILKTE
ncbi:MAG: hypothetical protein Harvfovirus16_10 [Harvfovirus sp.]|uniref:C2H2-type domain-containing protein n=1 Tax=Harvfovirus sp. TaxID=2487768 RepID=A0A3G5A6L5_9VIRU|nr:MAG: hypothetical protein Harvfovirus16_10 [Harvfovirus sp.]